MDIPDNKRFFRIGEVSRIIGVKTPCPSILGKRVSRD